MALDLNDASIFIEEHDTEMIMIVPTRRAVNRNLFSYAEKSSLTPLQQEAKNRAQKIMLIMTGPYHDGRGQDCLQYLFTYPVLPIQHFAKETVKILDQIKPELDWLQQNGKEVLKGMPRSEERFKKYIEEPKTGNQCFIGLDNLYVDMGKKLQGYVGDYDQEALLGSCVYISSHMSLLCDILK